MDHVKKHLKTMIKKIEMTDRDFFEDAQRAVVELQKNKDDRVMVLTQAILKWRAAIAFLEMGVSSEEFKAFKREELKNARLGLMIGGLLSEED